jgi:hypothetical protein
VLVGSRIFTSPCRPFIHIFIYLQIQIQIGNKMGSQKRIYIFLCLSADGRKSEVRTVVSRIGRKYIYIYL